MTVKELINQLLNMPMEAKIMTEDATDNTIFDIVKVDYWVKGLILISFDDWRKENKE